MTSIDIFQVVKPGLSTTFQDLGRTGFQRFGVPVSGAMDRYALQKANILVGNNRSEACLEVALIGPTLTALEPVTIVITGANLEPKVNGKLKPMWTTIRMNKGDELSFGRQRTGVFAYIAVAGGFDCPVFLGSKSTDVKSGFGTQLEKNDRIKGFPISIKQGLSFAKKPSYDTEIRVGLMEGPHAHLFSTTDREQFYQSTYRIEANSNRMGYRLSSDNNSLEHATSIWSDAIPFGGIQIPPNGSPIILMADRQTTGGYPRIGTVISTDLPKVAQLVPRGKIRFYPVSIEEAQQRVIRLEQELVKLEYFRKYIR